MATRCSQTTRSRSRSRFTPEKGFRGVCTCYLMIMLDQVSSLPMGRLLTLRGSQDNLVRIVVSTARGGSTNLSKPSHIVRPVGTMMISENLSGTMRHLRLADQPLNAVGRCDVYQPLR